MRKSSITAVLAMVTLIAAPFCFSTEGKGTVYVQRDMLSLIKDGKGRITVDTIDIGKPEEMFDGDLGTVVRSESINPFTATLILDSPMEFDRVRLHLIGETHDWTMEIADSEKDLDAEKGSYRKLVDNRHTEDAKDTVIFDKNIEARAFRLTVKRITGDDFVHIYEWEFPVEQKLKDLEILALNYAPRDTNYRDATEIFENTVLTLRATAVPEEGAKMDITPDVKWTVDGELWRDKPGRYLITKPGTVNVIAEYGSFKKTREIAVTRARDFIDGEDTDFTNDRTDLDVLFIERLPRLDYDGPNGGWPVDGSTVTWRACVRNWGKKKFDAVSYRFLMNGRIVKEGVIEDFNPETTRTVDWEWKWRKSRQKIAFEIDTKAEIEELSEFNNRIEDLTDALTVGFYVEEYLWKVAHEHQRRLNIGSNSFEDWAQRQVREWNELHSEAIFDGTPRGVIDRLRLDRVIVVPNNSLPMVGGLATNNPNNEDKTVDLIWGFESNGAYKRKNKEGKEEARGWRGAKLSGRENIGWGLMHELNHARYIIDSYGFDIHPKQVEILLDDGTPLVGSTYFPKGVLRYNKYKGLMGGGAHVCDEYMALAWNHVAGQRARGGNYNAPTVIGEYLQLHPKRNTFTFVDEQGSPLSNGEVWIYRTVGTGKGWYTKCYDNTVDLKFKLDEKGMADLPWTIFAEDGKIIHTYGNANSKVIVRVNHNGKVGFEFIEVSDFNVEYMKGHTEHGHYRITVGNLQGPLSE